MTTTIQASFDGSVLRPEEPLPLEPNTRVRVTVETLPAASTPNLFLETARSLELQGPSDWSSRVDDYLNGEADQ